VRRVSRRFAVGTLVALGVGLAAIQLVPVERTNPEVEWDVDAPREVARILRRSCYDCHSHETRWPWYSRVAPLSWWIVSHVREGRGDLNFSTWPALDLEAQELAFEDIAKQVSRGEMPLASYLILHPGARLSDDDRDALLRWAGKDPGGKP